MLDKIERIVMIVGAIIVGVMVLLTLIIALPKVLKDNKEFPIVRKKKNRELPEDEILNKKEEDE